MRVEMMSSVPLAVGRAVEHRVTVSASAVFLAPVAGSSTEAAFMAAFADHVGLVERAERLLGPGHVLRRYVADGVSWNTWPALLEQLVVRVSQLAAFHRGATFQRGLVRYCHIAADWNSVYIFVVIWLLMFKRVTFKETKIFIIIIS